MDVVLESLLFSLKTLFSMYTFYTSCFQGVENGCIGNKLVNLLNGKILII